MAFYRSKKNKKWLIKALDRSTGKTLTYVIGNRDTATFRELYDKVKHNENCTYFTDDWDAFSAVLPKDRHVIGKKYTTSIERNNSNTRHYIGRMTRRTKIVSHSEVMLRHTLNLWIAIAELNGYEKLLETLAPIFS